MKRGSLIWCVLLLLTNTMSSSQDAVSLVFTSTIRTDKTFFRLGDQVVTLKKWTAAEEKDFVLVNLHDNESSALTAAQLYLHKHGGQLLALENNKQHNLSFEFRNRHYSIDPNRIFSPKGRGQALKSGPYKNMLSEQVELLAKFVSDELPQDKAVIAVHNQHEGRTIVDYTKKKSLKYVRAYHRNTAQAEHDLFVTTDNDLFQQLRLLNYNVVLMDSYSLRDDGTLRHHYIRQKRTYVDVFAGEGQSENQLKMIEVVAGLLKTEKNI